MTVCFVYIHREISCDVNLLSQRTSGGLVPFPQVWFKLRDGSLREYGNSEGGRANVTAAPLATSPTEVQQMRFKKSRHEHNSLSKTSV